MPLSFWRAVCALLGWHAWRTGGDDLDDFMYREWDTLTCARCGLQKWPRPS